MEVRLGLQRIQLGFMIAGVFAGGALAMDDPELGIDFVTIGDVGNIPYPGGPNGIYAGRGSVDYEFRISQTEVTTGQYVDYLNMFSLQSVELWALLQPGMSGLRLNGIGQPWTPNYNLLDPEQAGINMSWKQAAMFCNWLHNGQSSDSETLFDGAYDISTLFSNGDLTYSGQATRHPDARYWIPSLDEHLKAGFYDLDKEGNGPGWWNYGYSSDEAPIHAVPGAGHVARELSEDEIRDLAGNTTRISMVPLGIYEDVRSPWGLFDLLGGFGEWLEDWGSEIQRGRLQRMANNVSHVFPELDLVCSYWEIPPFSSAGFRIASAVHHPADLNLDWQVNYFDVSAFISMFVAGDLAVDLDGDGDLDVDDVLVFLELVGSA